MQGFVPVQYAAVVELMEKSEPPIVRPIFFEGATLRRVCAPYFFRDGSEAGEGDTHPTIYIIKHFMQFLISCGRCYHGKGEK